MIRFFSANDPYRLIFVLFTMTGLGWYAHTVLPGFSLTDIRGMVLGEMLSDGKIMYSEIWDSTGPITALLNWAMESVAGRNNGLRHLLTILIFFLQAGYFGLLLNQNRAFDQYSYLPSLLYGVLVFVSLDNISFSREVLATSFLMLAINKVFVQIQFRNQTYPNIHVLGIFLGVASLCVLGYSVFFPATLLILLITTRINFNVIALITLGFLFPHLVLIFIHLLKGSLSQLWLNYYAVHFTTLGTSYISGLGLLSLAALPLLYLILGLLKGTGSMRLTKYQSQISSIMIIWLVFGVIEILISRQRTAQTMIVCIGPVAYFIHYYLIRIRKKWMAEVMLWILLIGVPVIASIALNGKIKTVDYQKIFPSNAVAHAIHDKKILILEDQIDLYRTNRCAAWFLEWDLSEELFSGQPTYEKIALINTSLTSDPPEAIIDPKGLMEPIFYRLPEQKSRYIKTEFGYALSQSER